MRGAAQPYPLQRLPTAVGLGHRCCRVCWAHLETCRVPPSVSPARCRRRLADLGHVSLSLEAALGLWVPLCDLRTHGDR